MGRGELDLIGSGRFADTLLGKSFEQGKTTLRESSARKQARDVEAAKRSGTMGAAAMMRAGNTPGSIGAGVLYDRMLQKRVGEIQDRSSDELSRGLADLSGAQAAALPGYVSQAGQWAEAPNKNVAEQAAMRGLYDQAKRSATEAQSRNVREQADMRGLYDQAKRSALDTRSRGIAQEAALMNMYDQGKRNATAMRLGSMTFEKGKSFWDKFMEGVTDAGQIASTAASLAGLFGGIPGMGGGGGGYNRTGSQSALGGGIPGIDF
jgi:hypothetical protein